MAVPTVTRDGIHGSVPCFSWLLSFRLAERGLLFTLRVCTARAAFLRLSARRAAALRISCYKDKAQWRFSPKCQEVLLPDRIGRGAEEGAGVPRPPASCRHHVVGFHQCPRGGGSRCEQIPGVRFLCSVGHFWVFSAVLPAGRLLLEVGCGGLTCSPGTGLRWPHMGAQA